MIALAAGLLVGGALAGPVVPPETRQLILGLSETWDSSSVTVTRWERGPDGWSQVGGALPARIGREGLAWGLGLHPVDGGPVKVEGDWRAPAGAFALGGAFGDAPALSAEWPYRQVSERDLWVEDPTSPHYNQHLVVTGAQPLTAWEEGQRMRMGDPAHALKLVVQHNAAPPKPGAGSAIFFHVWRGDGAHPTAGCTALARDGLEAIIDWLEPDAAPVYVLLPTDVHQSVRGSWGLP